MRTIAFIVAMLFGTAASLYSRFAALLFYLWFGLFRPQEWVYIDIERFRLSFVVGGLLIIPAILTGCFPVLGHPLAIGQLVFLGLSLLAQTNALNPVEGWTRIDMFLRLTLVCLLLPRVVTTRARLQLTLSVIALSIGFHASKYGVGYILRGGAHFVMGTGGAFAGNNEFALAVARVIPLLWALGTTVETAWLRTAMKVAAGLSSLAVVSTYSRGGALAMVMAIVTYALLGRRRLRTAGFLVLALVVAALAVPFSDAYMARMRTIVTYEEEQEGSALSRLHFWRVAVRMAEAYPTGVGLRNFESRYDEFDDSDGRYGRGRAVHSSHFQALAELGYLGAATWVALHVFALYLLNRTRRRANARGDTAIATWSRALTASIVGGVVGLSFGAAMLNDLNWISLALVMAIHLVYEHSPWPEPVTSPPQGTEAPEPASQVTYA